jgi:uncharacterized YigZ family protein
MSGPRRYRIPAARVRVEDRIEHSLFIATIEPATSVEQAKAALERIRAEFPDATHHCHAWLIGPPGSTANTAASDDGEPSGTAGQVMLKTLLNSDVGDVVAIVTRYYGGINLGRGGLVRAYSGGVQHALREMKTTEHVDLVNVQVVVPYAAVDAVQRLLQREGARVIAQAFSTHVALLVRMPVDREEEILRALADATNGAARIER